MNEHILHEHFDPNLTFPTYNLFVSCKKLCVDAMNLIDRMKTNHLFIYLLRNECSEHVVTGIWLGLVLGLG